MPEELNQDLIARLKDMPDYDEPSGVKLTIRSTETFYPGDESVQEIFQCWRNECNRVGIVAPDFSWEHGDDIAMQHDEGAFESEIDIPDDMPFKEAKRYMGMYDIISMMLSHYGQAVASIYVDMTNPRMLGILGVMQGKD